MGLTWSQVTHLALWGRDCKLRGLRGVSRWRGANIGNLRGGLGEQRKLETVLSKGQSSLTPALCGQAGRLLWCGHASSLSQQKLTIWSFQRDCLSSQPWHEHTFSLNRLGPTEPASVSQV